MGNVIVVLHSVVGARNLLGLKVVDTVEKEDIVEGVLEKYDTKMY
jgi:hypothetical protein